MWLLLCFIPLLIFLPGMGDFILLPHNSISDLTITHYPNMLYLKQNLIAGTGIPLWSTTILSGYPFIADPLSGIHYPPGWLALLFPLPFGFNLVAAIHLVFGACGVYLWLKEDGIKPSVAALTGLFFGLLPKLVSHYAAGHLSLIYAIVWTPWLLLAEKRWHSISGWRYLWRAPGIVLGIITLADPRWTFYAGLLWLVYFLSLECTGITKFNEIGRIILQLIYQGILAITLSATLLLPLYEFTNLSTRVHMTLKDILTLSLPISGFLNLFYPISGGNVEWVFYPGAVTIAILLVGLFNSVLQKRSLLWLITAAVALLLSFGSYLPGVESLTGIAGSILLRVPSRLLFVTAFCLVVAGGFILNELLVTNSGDRHIRLLPLIVCTMVIGIFAAGVYFMTGKLVNELIVGAIGMLLAMVAIQLFCSERFTGRIFILLISAIGIFNLIWADWAFMERKPINEVFAQGAEVAGYLSKQSGFFRVYSPSYSLPQQTAARYNLQLADGVDPLQLDNYWQYMIKAGGVPATGYSVTLPEFADGKPAIDNKTFIPDASALGLLNIRFIVAEFDQITPGLLEIDQIGDTRIYENQFNLPRAWVESGGGVRIEAEVLEYTANRITLQAQGPGQLVLSEIIYPGWLAHIDGQPTEITPYNNLLRSVKLDSGRHFIEFTFRPLTAFLGLWISLATLSILLGSVILNRIIRK